MIQAEEFNMTNPYQPGDSSELSMDEILKSIRNIITEDKMKQAVEPTPIFKHESTTNPSGARPLDPLPIFSKKEEFSPSEPQESFRDPIRSDNPYRMNIPVTDEIKHHEYQLQEPANIMSEREAVAEKVRSHLHEFQNSPVHERPHTHHHRSYEPETLYEEPSLFQEQNYSGESKLSEMLRLLIDQAVSNKIQHWIDTNLPRLVETALTKELEKVLRMLRF